MTITQRLRILILIITTCISVQSILPIVPATTKRTASITVFVHGSIFAFLSLLNVRDVASDLLHDNLLYVSLVKHIRENPLLEHEQLLFKLGPHHVHSAVIKQFWSESFRR